MKVSNQVIKILMMTSITVKMTMMFTEMRQDNPFDSNKLIIIIIIIIQISYVCYNAIHILYKCTGMFSCFSRHV
jgi:hypothetical protein